MEENLIKEFSRQVLEQADVAQLAEIIRKLTSHELKLISQLSNCRIKNSKSITNELATLCKINLLRSDHHDNPQKFADLSSIAVLAFCKESLKDSFDNPSKAQLDELTPVLIEKFGILRTQLMYAICIDSEANAAQLAQSFLTEPGALDITTESKSELVGHELIKHEPIPEEIKQSRNNRRERDRETRRLQSLQKRESKLEQRAVNKLHRQKNSKRVQAQKDLELADTQVELATIEVRKRVHPLITRFGEGAGLHDDVGRVGMAFIRFTGDPSGSGKERPVLVIAKNKKNFIVRPIYSHARWPAGAWRAVKIERWREAGLSNDSFVGDEVHKVKHKNLRLLGELSLHDWNRVCLGEVNSLT